MPSCDGTGWIVDDFDDNVYDCPGCEQCEDSDWCDHCMGDGCPECAHDPYEDDDDD